MDIKLIDSKLYNVSKYIEQELIANKYYNYVLNKDNCLNSITNNIINYLTTIDIKTVNKKDINNMISDELNNYLNKEIVIDNNSTVILDKFINDNFKNINSYDKYLNFFDKLNSFLSDINYIISPDVITELLNNNYLSNILENIVNKNIKRIEHGEIYDIFSNDTLVSFIEIYADKKGIKIDDVNELESDISSDDSYISDSISIYLKEIGKIKLLSKDEEQELARRVAMGDEAAREKFIEANLRLSVSIAKRYRDKGLSFQDLIQEGNLGLMRAVKDYKSDKGYRFSTYATYWIRQSISRAIVDKARNIRIPVHKVEEVNKYVRQVENMENRLGRQSTLKEKMDYLHLSKSKIEELERLRVDTISMNLKVGISEDVEFGFLIPDSKHSVEDYGEKRDLVMVISNFIDNSNLSLKEKEVLRLRYGIGDSNGNGMTLEEIGKMYGVTRERIRQIEAKGLKKLRRTKGIKDLTVYVDDPDKAIESLKIKSIPKYIDEDGIEYDYVPQDKRNKVSRRTSSIKKPSNDNRKSFSTIYELLEPIPKKDIDAVIENLDDKDKELLRQAYGEDLEHPVRTSNWNKDKNTKLSSLKTKIKQRIKKEKLQINLVESKKDILETDKDITYDIPNYTHISNNSSITTIYKHFSKYTKEQIDEIISKLDDHDLRIISESYGSDLENPVRGFNWEKVKNELYFKLIPKMKERLEETYDIKESVQVQSINSVKNEGKKELIMPRERKTIYEYLGALGIEREDIDRAIPMLDSKYKEIFYLANGEDLDNPKRSEGWNIDISNQYYGSVCPKLVTIIKYNNPEKYKDISLRKNDGSKNLKTIYKILDKYDFTKEQIDIAISKLSDEDKEIFYLANGEDLDNPKRGEGWTREIGYKYYNQVVRKIITRAKNLDKYLIPNDSEIIVNSNVESEVQEQSTEVKGASIEKNDYIKILDMLKSSSFEDMLKVLTVKEAVIVSLKFGYIDDKYFSNESISDFLGISKEEVHDSTIKSLKLFKEQITTNIDRAIEYNKKDFQVKELSKK